MPVSKKFRSTVTEEQIEHMKRMRSDGLTYAEIGRVMGLDKTTVRKYCLGVKAPGRRGAERRYDDSKRDLALDLLSKGWTRKRVAKMIGCSLSTLQGWMAGYSSKDDMGLLEDEEANELARDMHKAILACYRHGKVLG